MKNETKKKIIAVFILLAFTGSILTGAVSLALDFVFQGGGAQDVQTTFDRPLENSEEAPFLQQNYVVVKYFWSDNCVDCFFAEEALNATRDEVKGKLLIERIKVEDWRNYTDELGIKSVPTFYLKGQTIVSTTTTDRDELMRAICPLYFYNIEECAFLT